jgi:hypothetical protein
MELSSEHKASETNLSLWRGEGRGEGRTRKTSVLYRNNVDRTINHASPRIADDLMILAFIVGTHSVETELRGPNRSCEFGDIPQL